MKRALVIATVVFSLAGFAAADIQAPPGSTYTASRKLGRALSNILYGFIEVPEQMSRKTKQYGRKAGWSYGYVDGSRRALKRFGYGWYELFTFMVAEQLSFMMKTHSNAQAAEEEFHPRFCRQLHQLEFLR